MKMIIIPTDFSASADSAMHYGARMARAIGCPVHLLHVYQIPVSISDIPVMMISGEELKSAADEGLDRCREELQKNYPDLEVNIESRLGEITTELKDICHQMAPIAVVIGSHEESGLERMLFGSTTLSVVRNLRCPILAVPAQAAFSSIRNVVFATDLKEISESTVQEISEILQLFPAELHMVHVTVSGQKETAENLVQPDKYLRQLPASFHEVRDENVPHGIKTYVEKSKADLVIVIQHRHGFWDRMFSKAQSENVLMNVSVPVLFLPE